ncbi:MAG: hypothetical protein R3B70_33960 [Polyangiaceae bacterium]
MGRSLVTTARAFKLGLTNCVIGVTNSGTGDDIFTDPHKAFNNMAQLQATAGYGLTRCSPPSTTIGRSPDPTCSSQTLDKSVIFTATATPPRPRASAAWPDGTEGDSNWLYVMGGGYIRNGWYGSINADSNVGFDPRPAPTSRPEVHRHHRRRLRRRRLRRLQGNKSRSRSSTKRAASRAS